MLIEQTYPGPEDDRAHFEALLPAFTDPRHLTVDGRPVFYVFCPEQIPDAADWTVRWRAMAAAHGLPGLYLIAEMSDLLGAGPKCPDPFELGSDAGVYIQLPADSTSRNVLFLRATRKLLRGGPEVDPHNDEPHPMPDRYRGRVVHPAIFANRGNTPRSGRGGLVRTGTSPARFRRHVEDAARHAATRHGNEQLVLVKSRNEWAEGNYLEPDLEHGRAWLAALQGGLADGSRPRP